MKRTRSTMRRRMPAFPLLVGFCLLMLLCSVLVVLTLPQAQAQSPSPRKTDRANAAGPAFSPKTEDSPSSEAFGEEALPWNLTLVNFSHPLQESAPPELAPVDENGEQLDSRAAGALQSMLDDMRSQGLSPLVCSSYRAYGEQERLFQNQVEGWLEEGFTQEEAEEKAALLVARPGTSEHELGLSADIVAESNQLLDESQEHTAEQQWMLKHCQEYGFILRYPTGKTGLTGVEYEPWHYRYVGREAAQEIMAQGLCLEEYLVQR